jgi:superfamily II DNA/RNA helicase
MGALRQLAGIGKIPAAVEWMRKRVKDEKLVVFAFHVEVQERLAEALAPDSPLSITGEMSLKARRDAIQRFQSDPASRVIVCSLTAAQTAITLTAARRVLMVELDWTPSALEQAEDRVHRIGQTAQVEITYLRATGTLDDRMAAILAGKREAIATLAAAAAPFGYRKDGAPRKQPPGPGRPRLDPATRAARRKTSKAVWQASHPDWMREYMRKRRLEARINSARRAIQELALTEQLGYSGMLREMGGRDYKPSDYQRDLAQERVAAERAHELLARIGTAP